MTDPLRSARDDLTRRGLLRAARDADQALAREAARRPELRDAIAGWRGRIADLGRRATGDEARVAFVGAVKSGKSTLVNALLGEDVLPRGSGILTSQVTEVRQGHAPGLRVRWKSREEVNRDFAALLGALGRPGAWDLGNPTHRSEARVASAAAGARPRPQHAALRALLAGAPGGWEHLGPERREELVPGAPDLAGWASRDEVAALVASLALDVPAPEIPPGLVLVDCQGADAWNAAHARDLEAALQEAHALVYVISSRVGLREADFRLLETLGTLGLLELARPVLNLDLGELRAPGDLPRVLASVRRGLADAGVGTEVAVFSALQGLLERRLLLDPEAVHPGERRLVEAWDAASPAAAASRESFQAFRRELFATALAERDRWVITRARADLRQVLVEASRALEAARVPVSGLERAGWEADTADALLSWAQERLQREAEARKAEIRRAVAEGFGARRSPQQALWRERVRTLDPEPDSAWGEAAGDPVAAAAILGARLAEGAARVLAASEPLRVNALRNLALEARGALARAGEALGREAAALLEEAGLGAGPPPDRRELSGEITATRRVPLFRNRVAPGGDGETPGPLEPLARAARALGQRLAPRLPRARALGRAEAEGSRALLLRRLGSAWEEYVAEVLGACLEPHVDDAAAQVYARLASWVLSRVSREEGGVSQALDALDRPRSTASDPTTTHPLPEKDP